MRFGTRIILAIALLGWMTLSGQTAWGQAGVVYENNVRVEIVNSPLVLDNNGSPTPGDSPHNLYEFVAGSPHNLSDPLGLDWATDTLCFAQELEGRRNAVQQLPRLIGGQVNRMLNVMTFVDSLVSSLMFALQNNPQAIMGINNPQANINSDWTIHTELAIADVFLGLPILNKRAALGWIKGNNVPFINFLIRSPERTSIWSMLLRKAFPQTVAGEGVKTLVWRGFLPRVVKERVVGGIIARWLPVIGWAILAYDALSIGYSMLD